MCRFYACFEVDNSAFVVMNNIFSTPREITEIYDLKGSTIKRSNPNGSVKKDNDFKQKILLGSQQEVMKLVGILFSDIDVSISIQVNTKISFCKIKNLQIIACL